MANKIAYLNSIKRREKELVSSRLIRIIEKETATLIQSLSSSGRTERIDRLRLILTKLAINYSHLPYLEEPTTEEGVIQILSASEEIRRSIAKGFEMARDIGF